MKEEEIVYWLLSPDNAQIRDLSLGAAKKKLAEFSLLDIFLKIEKPLTNILEEMHGRGVALDPTFLKKLKKDLTQRVEDSRVAVYKLADKEFNLNSPKQLLTVLFDDLKITPRLKTTAADQLVLIKDRHPIIDPILNYRESFKILSTYVEPLLQLGDVVRTIFSQTGAATGRLSSQNPNLQNITDLVRPAFIARPGYKLVSFDYSQIELRVLASVAGDFKMIEAFKSDLDIHQLTASQVFNIPLTAVTKEMRRVAKTLNFGVIYGMGAVAFAKNSGLTVKEARKFIEEYFQDFGQIREWQKKVIEETKARGYVENLNGRKRWLPAINSQDQRVASEAERAAINMPIQSLAADIIKLAMIQTRKFPLLLSIHDELLFELPDDRVKESVTEIKTIMESVYKLAVPLRVNVGIGANWGHLKDYV